MSFCLHTPDITCRQCAGRREQSTGIPIYPCEAGGNHDFAVGGAFAVCNRCERVIPLDGGERDG